MRLLIAAVVYFVAYDLSRRWLGARARAHKIGPLAFGICWGLVVAALPWWLMIVGGADLSPGVAALASAVLFVGVVLTARLKFSHLDG